MARSASVTRLARSSMGRLERGYWSMRLISAMSLSLSRQAGGDLLADDRLAQAMRPQQVFVRAECVDELVFQAKGVQRAGGPIVPRDLLDHRRQAVALGMFFNDQHGLKLRQDARDSRHVERLERMHRD